jgi:hypothetical protein
MDLFEEPRVVSDGYDALVAICEFGVPIHMLLTSANRGVLASAWWRRKYQSRRTTGVLSMNECSSALDYSNVKRRTGKLSCVWQLRGWSARRGKKGGVGIRRVGGGNVKLGSTWAD